MPQASARASGRRFWFRDARTRQPPTTTTSPIANGGNVLRLACVCPADGCPIARNPATPTDVAPTPVNKTTSPRLPPGYGVLVCFRRCQAITTPKTRSNTRSGCTTARLPKLSATTCSANPTMLAPMAASHNGWRTRSSMIRGESVPRVSTRLVLRMSATAATPRNIADATAAPTAIGVEDKSLPVLEAQPDAELAQLRPQPQGRRAGPGGDEHDGRAGPDRDVRDGGDRHQQSPQDDGQQQEDTSPEHGHPLKEPVQARAMEFRAA